MSGRYIKVRGPLIKADVVDSDGDIYPREVLEKAVAEFNERHKTEGATITHNFQGGTNLGSVSGLEMDGATASVSAFIDADRKDPFEKTSLEFAVGGKVVKSHEEERDGKSVKVIDVMQIGEVTLTEKKTK